MGSEGFAAFSPYRLIFHETPNVVVEAAKLALHCQERFCVSDGGIDLEAITNDAGILQKRRDFALVVFGDLLWIETVESGAIVVTLAKNGFPTEPRLSSFENQKLKKTLVVVNGHAPLFIVVGD